MPRKLEGFGTWGEVFGLTETQRNVITVELSGEGKHPELNLTIRPVSASNAAGLSLSYYLFPSEARKIIRTMRKIVLELHDEWCRFKSSESDSWREKMKLIEKTARYEIYAIKEDYGIDYYVYGYYQSGDAKVCPSLDMARSYAAGC